MFYKVAFITKVDPKKNSNRDKFYYLSSLKFLLDVENKNDKKENSNDKEEKFQMKAYLDDYYNGRKMISYCEFKDLSKIITADEILVI